MTDNIEERRVQSSIEVSRNAKKEYSLKVKCYFSDDIEDTTPIVNKIKDTYTYLEQRFEGK